MEEYIKLIKKCEEQNKIDSILTIFELCSDEQIIFFKKKIKEFKNVYVKDIPEKGEKEEYIKCFNNNKVINLNNTYCRVNVVGKVIESEDIMFIHEDNIVLINFYN